MSAEHLNSGNQGEHQRIKFSRRKFFWQAAKLAAAGGVVGLTGFVVGNEIVKGKDGIVKTQ